MRELPPVILGAHEHRPWAMPTSPWIMRQSWVDFLFCHWPVKPEAIRPLVPPELELDLWDGMAWVGVIPFHMAGVTLRLFPDIPGFSAFPELNVRTYARSGGKHGVFFLSLEAGHRLAVWMARNWYMLPYYRAAMEWHRDGDWIEYQSRRVHRGAPPAAWSGRYRPTGPVNYAVPGSFDHWLTERYALFVVDRKKRVHRADVHHKPWPLQPAEAEIRENTMAASHGLTLPQVQPVHVMYASRCDTVVWRLAPVVV